MNCDEYLMKQIDDLKTQLHEQQVKYDKLSEEMTLLKEKCVIDKYELKMAVKEGTYEAMEKFEEKQDVKFKLLEEKVNKKNLEYDNRLRELETEKFKKWQFAIKTAAVAALTTTVGWVVNSLITNFIFIKR